MALENKYKNPEKYKGKIKIRNLDPEVISLINSHGGSGGGYDDTSIRQDLEYIRETVNSHDTLINNINNKISSAATKVDLANYRRKDIDITFNDLEPYLKDKINSIGSSGGSGSTDLTDVNNKIQELASKVTINTGNIDTNRDNLNSLTNLFNQFKNEMNSSQQIQTATIVSNTNRIQQLEENYGNNPHIGIEQLDPELAEKINQLSTLINNFTQLEQKVNTNILSINNIKTNLDQTHQDFNNLQESLQNSINTINNTINSHKTNLDSLNNELHNLTIDKIIAFTNIPSEPDKGKIKESNLTTELARKINNVTNMSDEFNNIKNSILHLGLNVSGAMNQFIYKKGDDLSTKSILYIVSIANSPEELATLQSQNKNLIYDKPNNILYIMVADEQPITKNTEVAWKIIEDSLLNPEYNFTFFFNEVNHELIYNNSGTLITLLTSSNAMGDWSFVAKDNKLQLNYKQDVFQEWGIGDLSAISLMQEPNILANKNEYKQIYESIYNIKPYDELQINMDQYEKYNLRMLILDPQYNLYAENDGSYNIKIIHIDIGIKIINKNNNPVTIKLLRG